MPSIDSKTGNLIVHIVYDGCPCSGKTETVRSLGRLLRREVYTPEERDGRTLLFDWMDYQGGLRMGRPIQCRVIAVPGQVELRRRRAAILSAADAVVFVADSTPAGFDMSTTQFADLQDLLAQRKRAVPIVLQLNKRDLGDALPADQMLASLEGPDVRKHTLTVATEGTGARETFVFAVAEALRALEEEGQLYRIGSNEHSTQEVVLPEPDMLQEILKGYGPPRV
ncbi:MAG: GTPase domain-containing protein [Acidobacteriota bacterium]